jgi:hypothetical protein
MVDDTSSEKAAIEEEYARFADTLLSLRRQQDTFISEYRTALEQKKIVRIKERLKNIQ